MARKMHALWVVEGGAFYGGRVSCGGGTVVNFGGDPAVLQNPNFDLNRLLKHRIVFASTIHHGFLLLWVGPAKPLSGLEISSRHPSELEKKIAPGGPCPPPPGEKSGARSAQGTIWDPGGGHTAPTQHVPGWHRNPSTRVSMIV